MHCDRSVRPARCAGLAALVLLAAAAPVHASLVLSEFGTTVGEGFDGFTGAGFAPKPMSGQLDSDAWRITGLSDGDAFFGGTFDSGDFARGTSGGGVSTAGTYAFDVGGGDTALGFQAGGSDMTPGAITLRVQNGTGAMVDEIAFSFDVYVFNDQGRSSSLESAFSHDDDAWTEMPWLAVATTEVADPVPAWQVEHRSVTLTGLGLAPGASLFLRWRGDDLGGSGSRDEIAIDNIALTAVPGPGALGLLALGTGLARRRRR